MPTPTRARLHNFSSLINMRALRKPLVQRQDRALSKELDAFGFDTTTRDRMQQLSKDKGDQKSSTRRKVDSQLTKPLAPQKVKTQQWVPSKTYTVGKMYPYKNIVAGSVNFFFLFTRISNQLTIRLCSSALSPSSSSPHQTPSSAHPPSPLAKQASSTSTPPQAWTSALPGRTDSPSRNSWTSGQSIVSRFLSTITFIGPTRSAYSSSAARSMAIIRTRAVLRPPVGI